MGRLGADRLGADRLGVGRLGVGRRFRGRLVDRRLDRRRREFVTRWPTTAVPGGHAQRAQAVDAHHEPRQEADPRDQRDQSQDPEPGEERTNARAGGRALHEQPAEDQRRSHVAERRQDVQPREQPESERDPDDRRQDQDRHERAEDADERTPTERRQHALAGGGRSIRGPREQAHEEQTEYCDRDRRGQPQVREEPDDDTGEDALEVDALHVAFDGAARDPRCETRHDVAFDVRAVGHDHPTAQRHDVAFDVSGDARVAVRDHDTTRDVSADDQLAVADEHEVFHRARDTDRTVDRGHHPVHRVTPGNDDVADDADLPISRRAAVTRRHGGGRGDDDGDDRECDDGDHVTTHASSSGA